MSMNRPIKKALFVNQTGRFGGAERVLLDLLLHLDRSRVAPVLVSPEGAMQQEAIKAGISWIEAREFERMDTTRGKLSGRDAGQTIRLFRKLNAIIKEQQPDLIYSNSVKAHLLVNLMRRKTPTFVRLHDFPSSFGGMAKRMFRYALCHADHISCVSQSVESDLRTFINDATGASISHAHNGYELKPAASSVAEQRHTEEKRIIIAGWLLAWKGFDVFVEAMERIAAQLPDWQFVIAGAAAEDAQGSMAYAEQLRARVARSPFARQFLMYGGYKSLHELACCAAHSVFVHASIRPDPLPTVLLEASGAKLPIVCSNLGGSREIIRHGWSGLVVPPTAEALAEHVLKLAQNEALRVGMAEHAYTSCGERFRMQGYVDRMTDRMMATMERVR
ncbi:glycosyl transferase group 1 [Paenibacillus curdlanolyticus YK9]|uniref:Glycosyl transferase group 1 n=1 Tax=Paenibacillus curdlanolyticus YK9 TaxID=717606 RepID=E0IER2_9BACL|nr:glycosyltransferase family 4 protein [Paenibacillus curdlanolyticus]EFM09150.1 glycosyl transferase group 1 [Paenibacillus curdlanolyticus YK9]